MVEFMTNICPIKVFFLVIFRLEFLFFSVKKKMVSSKQVVKTSKVKGRRKLEEKIKQHFKPKHLKTLRGILKERRKEVMWGKVTNDDGLQLFLYHLLESDSSRKMESNFGIAKSSFYHNMDKVAKLLGKWSDSVIKEGTKEEMEEVSKNEVDDDEFKDAALNVDGIHLNLEKQDHKKTKSPHHSFKLNGHGRAFQCANLQSGKWVFISKGMRPKKRDNQAMVKVRRVFNRKFNGCKVLGDCHYAPLQSKWKKTKWVCSIPKPKNRELNSSQKAWNVRQRRVRNKIELGFGKLKNRFKILQKKWNRDRKILDVYFKICLALDNLINDFI